MIRTTFTTGTALPLLLTLAAPAQDNANQTITLAPIIIETQGEGQPDGVTRTTAGAVKGYRALTAAS